MNRFKEIKNILNPQEVVQKYLGLQEKKTSTGLWYKSPFRKERTASFCVSNKGIHDFGDSTHYDIISFVQKYFNTTPSRALEILCNDFGLYGLGNEYETQEIIKRLKKKRYEERLIKQKIEEWYSEEFQRVCDEIIINQKCLKIFEKTANFEVLRVLYDEQVKLECYSDVMFDAVERTKERLYLDSH